MWICAFRSLHPRCLGSLLLSLLLVLSSPSVVQAAGKETTAPDCAQTGLASQSVAVQLTRSAEQVQGRLHSAPSDLPASGCRVSLHFQIPKDARPPQTVWRDVDTRAVRIDGTPDPAHPEPLPLRLWIHPDGLLQYEVREAGPQATHAALDLTVAWGTTAAANDLAVLDILGTVLGKELDILNPDQELELELWELGALLDDSGRVMYLDWHDTHPDEYWEESIPMFMAPPTRHPKVGIHPPDVRVIWQLPSELGQLTALSRLALGGPLLIGTIPPELGQLTNLERLTLAGSRLTGAVPPELGQLAQLWKLELHHNRLTALPPELGRLLRLTHLSLAGNQLTALPPELGRLTQMHLLGVAGNQLTALPPELGQLTQIVGLGVAGNRLTALPPELGQLSRLKALDAQDNLLTSLPSLAGLEQLRYLNLSGNQLTNVPPELPQLRHLSRLDLSDNRLMALPPGSFTQPRSLSSKTNPFLQTLVQMAQQWEQGIPYVSPLTMLDLSGNRLTTLPPELARLRLNLLDLSDNQLTSLPPEIGRIRPPRLPNALLGTQPRMTLDLSGNQLTDLPDALFQLNQLQELNLGGNPLGTVPPELGNLSTLETLGLSSILLTAQPPELGQLSQLVSLDLSGNQLTILPPELEQASHLGHLNLSGNQLTDLPAGLGQLSQLDSLDLSDNRLMDLSDRAAELATIRSYHFWLSHLDLSHNQLAEIPPVITRFHLEVLNLSHNQLTDLHLDRNRLTQLEHLNLSHNQLTDLPLELGQRTLLTHLDLSHNRFSEIPPVLSQLHPLLSLDLRGNPLTTCLLPLPWQIDRYIFPPDYELFGNFDHWLLSPRSGTQHPDLPFLELCLE